MDNIFKKPISVPSNKGTWLDKEFNCDKLVYRALITSSADIIFVSNFTALLEMFSVLSPS